MDTSANGNASHTGKCGSCHAFVMAPDNRTGNCHARPPTSFWAPQKDTNGKIMTDVNAQIILTLERIFPPVYPDIDWCLEHPWWQERAHKAKALLDVVPHRSRIDAERGRRDLTPPVAMGKAPVASPEEEGEIG
jgi:hypothetical protein